MRAFFYAHYTAHRARYEVVWGAGNETKDTLGLGLSGVEHWEGEAAYCWDPWFIPYAGSSFHTLYTIHYITGHSPLTLHTALNLSTYTLIILLASKQHKVGSEQDPHRASLVMSRERLGIMSCHIILHLCTLYWWPPVPRTDTPWVCHLSTSLMQSIQMHSHPSEKSFYLTSGRRSPL